jgi:hypothetical protein
MAVRDALLRSSGASNTEVTSPCGSGAYRAAGDESDVGEEERSRVRRREIRWAVCERRMTVVLHLQMDASAALR